MNSKIMIPVSFIMIFLIMPIISSAQAPCIPTRFYGDVAVNGNPAPAGLKITAEIDGVEMAETITQENGKYGFAPYTFDVPDNDNNCDNQAIVKFYIRDVLAGESMLEGEGDDHLVRLDLSASGVQYCGDGSCNGDESCSSCPKDCGECSNGGGSSGGGPSGGGGGGAYVPQECTPDWECSSWSQCINGTQARECIDVDECDTEEGKPPEEQDCGIKAALPDNCEEGETICVGRDVFECGANSVWHENHTCEDACSEGFCVESVEETSSDSVQGAGITGLLFGNPVMAGGAGVLVLMLIAGGYFLWKRGGKPSKQSKQ